MTITPNISITDEIISREGTRHSIILTFSAVYNSRCINGGLKTPNEMLLLCTRILDFTPGKWIFLCMNYFKNFWILHTLLCETSHRRSMKQNAFINKSSHNLKSYRPYFGWLSAALYRMTWRIFTDLPEVISAP